MQLTKQQVIAVGVLLAAIAAFVTDRWVIGHEEDAAALVAPDVASRPAATARRPVARQVKPQGAVAAASDAEPGFGAVGALAARLEQVRAAAEAKGQPIRLDAVRDAFRPPPMLLGSRKVESVDESEETARRFVERHKLAAVVKRQSGGGVAIIEDRTAAAGSITMAVGQKLNGFTLVSVQDRVVIMRRGAQRVELRLQDDPNQGTIVPSEKMAVTDPGR